jgi:AraC-like DNA-binding protein
LETRAIDQPLQSADAYLTHWDGAAFATQHSVCWHVDSGLRCVAVWGRPTVGDANTLLRAFALEARPDHPIHTSYVDYRGMTGVDDDVYAHFVRGMADLAPGLGHTVRQAALVHDGGIGAAAGAGYGALLGSPWPVSTHLDPIEALQALGIPTDRGHSIKDQLERLVARARAGLSIQERVRQAVAHDLTMGVDACAKHLGMSSRSLQRQLKATDNSFRTVSEATRMARAEALLRDTDHSVLSIAREVGYAKVHGLSDAFQRRHGIKPTAWRSQFKP